MLKTYIKLILPSKILFLLLFTTGCMPAIFTVATTSTISVAGDRSVGTAIDDAKISARIKAGFIKNNFRELYTKISINVMNGRVLYTGTVDKEEDMLNAVEIAWDINDVKEVVNELAVDKKSNHFDLLQYTRDSMITAQVSSKLFLNRDVKFVNYTVVTVNDVVYIFGIARSEEELEKVTNIASRVHGVQKVVCHAKLRENIHN